VASSLPPWTLPLGPVPPSTPRTNPLAILGVLLLVVGFLAFALGGIAFPFGGFPAGLVCGFPLFILGMILLATSSATARRTLPPPPPIQQPMVPAGIQGAQELACPNCGAAPRTVDRFGIATCDYCGTRFLVR